MWNVTKWPAIISIAYFSLLWTSILICKRLYSFVDLLEVRLNKKKGKWNANSTNFFYYLKGFWLQSPVTPWIPICKYLSPFTVIDCGLVAETSLNKFKKVVELAHHLPLTMYLPHTKWKGHFNPPRSFGLFLTHECVKRFSLN